MKICLVCVEIFAWGKYGGFGRSARMLGRELVRRGYDVTAVVPRREDQKRVEMLDGIRILGFDRTNPMSMLRLFREANADIYHSQEPSFATYLAQIAMPHRKHIVTFRDTRFINDWWVEFKYPSKNHLQVFLNFLYEDNFLVSRAVRRADRCFATANFLIPKARTKYRLSVDPVFLPSPIPFVENVSKSTSPLVCFVARLDRRKRPYLFFELARKFPHVQFESIGVGQDVQWERTIQSKYMDLPNLKFHGFVDQFSEPRLLEIWNKAWILVNTSARESLPTTFVEATGNGCAILSEIDPDGFASQFGYRVENGDYESGMRFLLEDDRWRMLGQKGRDYTTAYYGIDEALRRHITIYDDL